MKVPVSWLREYIDLNISIEELAYRLTLAGLEVDTLTYVGIPPGEIEKEKAVPMRVANNLIWDRDKLVIGYIHEVKAHPDADKLVLAMVDHGADELEQAVTGAPNLFQYEGKGQLEPPLPIIFAREGAELLDAYADDWPNSRTVLEPRSLRGIMNKTMVCSEREVGLSEAHGGVVILETDAAPGTPLQDVLGDVIIELELTPNMARAFSIVGIAREAAALTGQPLSYPPTDITAEGPPIEGQVGLEIHEPELNPRFTLALLKGVTIEPSPQWMKRRLQMAGMRPVNNIVDITNYVMLETGQPLHAFDYDILVERAGGEAPTIITRLPEEGERLTTLDDIDRALDPFTILVADTAGALSFGGIMGGAESEINDETTNVLLEAAAWNYINIRQTLSAQRERGKPIVSEAGARFSRGVHPELAIMGLRRAIEMMREVAGGEIAEGVIDDYPLPPNEISVTLPMSEVKRILGVAIPIDEAERILAGLEFGVERAGDDALHVTVPPHRMDIRQIHNEADRDIADMVAQADLLEEIARIYGYDRIPNTMLIDELPPQRTNVPLQREELVRDMLVSAGLQEIISYRMTTPEHEAMLTPEGAESHLPDVPYITLANPITADKTVLRHTLIGGMLEALATNKYHQNRLALFEVGKVYLPVEGRLLPDEPPRLCIGMMGERGVPSWLANGSDGEPLMDFYDLKGVVEALLAGLHIPDVAFTPVEHNTFFPGRVAALHVAGHEAGVLGQVHPLVVQTLELPEIPVLVAELHLDVLMAATVEDYDTVPLSPYPAVFEDIAVVVNADRPADEVEAVIRQGAGDLLSAIQLFDVYEGPQVGDGKKSLAYALTFQAPDRTLRDKDVAKIRKKIVKTLKDKLNAALRE